MLIVLDTNQLYDAPFLNTPNFKILQEYIQRFDNQAFLVVPEIVIREAVKMYRRKLTDSIRQLKGAAATVRRQLGDLGTITLDFPDDIDVLAGKYETELRKILRTWFHDPLPAKPLSTAAAKMVFVILSSGRQH
jgi:predicted nucleic acid-binding protein